MKLTTLAPIGFSPDVAFVDGQIVVVWSDDANKGHVYRWSDGSLSIIGTGSFPRINSRNEIIYREGPPDYRAALLNDSGRVIWRSQKPATGNSPVAINDDYLAVQTTNSQWITVYLLPAAGPIAVQDYPGASTGIAWLRVNGGRPVLVKDAFGSEPGLYNIHSNGDVVVGETARPSNLVRVGSLEAELWIGQDAQTPRCAVLYDVQQNIQTIAVVTWGRQGVRLAELSLEDLGMTAPTVPPVPPIPPSIPPPTIIVNGYGQRIKAGQLWTSDLTIMYARPTTKIHQWIDTNGNLWWEIDEGKGKGGDTTGIVRHITIEGHNS